MTSRNYSLMGNNYNSFSPEFRDFIDSFWQLPKPSPSKQADLIDKLFNTRAIKHSSKLVSIIKANKPKNQSVQRDAVLDNVMHRWMQSYDRETILKRYANALTNVDNETRIKFFDLIYALSPVKFLTDDLEDKDSPDYAPDKSEEEAQDTYSKRLLKGIGAAAGYSVINAFKEEKIIGSVLAAGSAAIGLHKYASGAKKNPGKGATAGKSLGGILTNVMSSSGGKGFLGKAMSSIGNAFQVLSGGQRNASSPQPNRDFTPKEEDAELNNQRTKTLELLEQIEENTRDPGSPKGAKKRSLAGGLLGGAANLLAGRGIAALLMNPYVLGAIASVVGAVGLFKTADNAIRQTDAGRKAGELVDRAPSVGGIKDFLKNVQQTEKQKYDEAVKAHDAKSSLNKINISRENIDALEAQLKTKVSPEERAFLEQMLEKEKQEFTNETSKQYETSPAPNTGKKTGYETERAYKLRKKFGLPPSKNVIPFDSPGGLKSKNSDKSSMLNGDRASRMYASNQGLTDSSVGEDLPQGVREVSPGQYMNASGVYVNKWGIPLETNEEDTTKSTCQSADGTFNPAQCMQHKIDFVKNLLTPSVKDPQPQLQDDPWSRLETQKMAEAGPGNSLFGHVPAPWGLNPMMMLMGQLADAAGMPNTPGFLPTTPVPFRAAAFLGQKAGIFPQGKTFGMPSLSGFGLPNIGGKLSMPGLPGLPGSMTRAPSPWGSVPLMALMGLGADALGAPNWPSPFPTAPVPFRAGAGIANLINSGSGTDDLNRIPFPTNLLPPMQIGGAIADKLGMPNTPAPLPSMPVPLRGGLYLMNKLQQNGGIQGIMPNFNAYQGSARATSSDGNPYIPKDSPFNKPSTTIIAPQAPHASAPTPVPATQPRTQDDAVIRYMDRIANPTFNFNS